MELFESHVIASLNFLFVSLYYTDVDCFVFYIKQKWAQILRFPTAISCNFLPSIAFFPDHLYSETTSFPAIDGTLLHTTKDPG